MDWSLVLCISKSRRYFHGNSQQKHWKSVRRILPEWFEDGHPLIALIWNNRIQNGRRVAVLFAVHHFYSFSLP